MSCNILDLNHVLFFDGIKYFKGKVAIAVSGGMDSMVLLHAVSRLRDNYVTMDSVIVLHIDHGICPESRNWANMVQKTCDDYALELVVSKLDGLYAGMPNLENTARNLRHEELHGLCVKHNVSTLFLAHHANDQVETVLLNLFRGSGLSGMGMPKGRVMSSKNDPAKVLLFKPFLDITKGQIEEYARHYNLSWIEDPSNKDTSYRRNSIRHNLLPVIKSIDDRAFGNILNFSKIALNTTSTEVKLANIVMKECISETEDHFIINWGGLKYHDVDIKYILIRTWLSSIGSKPPTRKKLIHILSEIESCKNDNSTKLIFSFYHDGRNFLKTNGVIYACK